MVIVCVLLIIIVLVKGVAFTLGGCKECLLARRARGRGIHGATSLISNSVEQMRPNEELSRNGQLLDISVSDEDSVVQSPRTKLKRRLKCKEKGKEKMAKACTSDQSESDGVVSDGGPQELRTDLAKRALKTTNKRLQRSTLLKNTII